MAVAFSLGMIGVVRIGHPIRCFLGVGGTISLLGRGVALFAVAQEIDAVERLGAHPPAEVDELVGAHAIRLLAAPDVVAHPGTLSRRTDTFAPPVVAAVLLPLPFTVLSFEKPWQA